MREPLAKLVGGRTGWGWECPWEGGRCPRLPTLQVSLPLPPPAPASSGCQALERRRTPRCETRGHLPKGSSMGTALQGLVWGQRTPM